MTLRNSSFAAAILISLTVFPGCGYRLVGTDLSVLPPEIKKIALPPLINNTNEPNLEQPFSMAVRERFLSIDRFEIIKAKEKADAVITITITGYNENIPISFGSNKNASEYRLELNLDAVVKDAKGETLWYKNNMFVFAEYLVDSDPSVTRNNEIKAKQAAAQEFARDFFSYLY
ncbi:MAG: LPS assembly lipoprotein LptE [bacterium]